MNYECPRCGASFTDEDVRSAQEFKASYILYKHGMSYRAIAKLFGWGAESAKYRVEKYENKLMKGNEDNDK